MFKYFSISFIGSVAEDPVLLIIPVLVLTMLLGAATEEEGMEEALPLFVVPFPPLLCFAAAPFPFPLDML